MIGCWNPVNSCPLGEKVESDFFGSQSAEKLTSQIGLFEAKNWYIYYHTGIAAFLCDNSQAIR